jgi:hypothetical protein
MIRGVLGGGAEAWDVEKSCRVCVASGRIWRLGAATAGTPAPHASRVIVAGQSTNWVVRGGPGVGALGDGKSRFNGL